jgi:D-alanyl-D-alanine carboxypeptidase/D-alanyl-D-alanine-endopeptidase (penicillin-binding protein 4)
MAAMSGLRPSRRAVLAGGLALLAAPAVRRAGAATPTPGSILANSGLSGQSAVALADADTGAPLEAWHADAALPPASVAKVVTTLYALDALGPGHRFETTVRANGPLSGGVLRGDLALVGGGDPVLDTDALGRLVAALRAAGLGAVEGRFRVAEGALPAVAAIDADQPASAGYNATIAGTNLNFNRVFLSWAPGETGPKLAFSAPGATWTASPAGFAAELAPGGRVTHRIAGGREVWTLPRPSLRGRGSLWLPVRAPGPYAGEVFACLAADAGVDLPAAEFASDAAGAALAVHASPPLDAMLRDMLRYSTNLTAECVGLRATQAHGLAPDGLAASGGAMTAWARTRYGLTGTTLVNHSGLSDASRVTARDLLAVLTSAADGPLPALLPERPILDAERKPLDPAGVRVVSKTGTLNFACGLAGYMLGRRRLAFAIFATDPALRARLRPEERDDPPGAAAWARRARAQEQALLRRWASLYAAG